MCHYGWQYGRRPDISLRSLQKYDMVTNIPFLMVLFYIHLYYINLSSYTLCTTSEQSFIWKASFKKINLCRRLSKNSGLKKTNSSSLPTNTVKRFKMNMYQLVMNVFFFF